MNMLNRSCKTSFAKPEFLKKAQRVNPRLYDIGCYNDNLALMLAPESDEMIRVIPTTSVSRPQLKSNQLEDRGMSNNSQGKKQEVEDHRRKFKFSNNKMSVTACNDRFNAKTSRRDNSIHRRLGCQSKHDQKISNSTDFVEKFLGMVKFRNDQIAPILGYGDLRKLLLSTSRLLVGRA
ncbi:hypothetical protein Tco_0530851 [Tanacetum coccineum]